MLQAKAWGEEKERLGGGIPCRAVCFRVSPSLCGISLLAYSCSICCRTDSSLMTAKQGTDLGVQQNAIQSHFIATFFFSL